MERLSLQGVHQEGAVSPALVGGMHEYPFDRRAKQGPGADDPVGGCKDKGAAPVRILKDLLWSVACEEEVYRLPRVYRRVRSLYRRIDEPAHVLYVPGTESPESDIPFGHDPRREIVLFTR